MRNIKVSFAVLFPVLPLKVLRERALPYIYPHGHLQLLRVWHNKMSKEVSLRRSSLVSVA